MATHREVAFERPPVRSVRLILHFKPTTRLTPRAFAGLVAAWVPCYPEVQHEPPMPPALDSEGAGFEFLGEDSDWPLGFITMSDEASSRRVFFQSDRLGLHWQFAGTDESPSTYPGFDSLKRELLQAYATFSSMVEPLPPIVAAAECIYTNHVGTRRIGDYLAGALTKWKAGTAELGLGEGARFSTHVHNSGDPGLYWWVDAQSQGDDPGFDLRLDVRTEGERLDPDAAICRAHDQLIEAFYEWTSPEMRGEWGEQ